MGSRYGLKRVYIMKGGMNEWFNTIVKENVVSGTPSTVDLDLISFRKAARQFLIGTGETSNTATAEPVKEKVQVIRKVPKPAAGGGC